MAARAVARGAGGGWGWDGWNADRHAGAADRTAEFSQEISREDGMGMSGHSPYC